MARPRKEGMAYFSFDVDFFSNKKIKILKARYGSDGITIFLYLLCEIYKNGYYLKIDDELVGAILLKDEAKHGTKEAIQALNSRGIVTKMFTGDNKKAAKQIAEELGISEFAAEMLPDQKYFELEKELEKYKGTNGKVAFVGDGINDSPVLARADVGISMGGVGSGSAIEASDVVIMTDELLK